MKKYKFISLLSLTSLLSSSCFSRNPFAKYADHYVNVIWQSTSASSLDIRLYVLEENAKQRSCSLCIINQADKNYYLCGSIGDSLGIVGIDDYGTISSKYFLVSTSMVTLKKGVYKSNIDSIINADKFLDVKKGDYIELEMKEFNPKEEATPLMFSSVKYTSTYYNFTAYSKERGYSENLSTDDTFFVSYGTMYINNTYIDVALKFLPDNKFFIFRNDNLEDIIYSGTYTNKWTDITLNFETNEIDDTKSIDIKAEFFS